MAVVVLTGASSFLGASFLNEVASRHPEWEITALVLGTPLGVSSPNVHPLTCDLMQAHAQKALHSVRPSVIVHMASAILEKDVSERNRRMLDQVLAVCRDCQARLIFVSSSQVLFSRHNAYALSKKEQEDTVRQSGVDFVILRPASPYGPRLLDHRPRREQSMHVLVRAVKRSPLVPVIGNGAYTRQPLHVKDLSVVLERLIMRPVFKGETFDLGGPEVLTMDQIIEILSKSAGKRVWPVHVPKTFCLWAGRVLPQFNPDLISTVDCDERVNSQPLLNAVSYPRLIPFEEGARDLME